MRTELRSLRSMRKMPLPERPWVRAYGDRSTKYPHDIRLFPACIRERNAVRADAVLEAGQSSCFFHPKLTATALCEVSGRMICDLCKTEFNGKVVSFEALQSLLVQKGMVGRDAVRIRWDEIALVLAVLPMLLIFPTVITAPTALVICAVHWRKGPTSIVRRSGWRYLVAGLLALGQSGFWLWLFFQSIS